MTYHALAADLMFASRIRAAAEAAGAPLQLARSADELVARLRAGEHATVLLDLETRGLDVAATIAAVRGEGASVVAFVSHVRADLIAEARLAGADRVLARSAFVRELPSLFAGDAGGTAGAADVGRPGDDPA